LPDSCLGTKQNQSKLKNGAEKSMLQRNENEYPSTF